VHVTSTGGQVVAELQQSIVRGLTPGGIDIIGPSAGPVLDAVIAGLVISTALGVQQLQGGGLDYDDVQTVLRLFMPGQGTVATTISVVPEDGVGTGTSFALDIDAGRVVDVPIPELDDGSYTVRIVSAVPLIAAARVTTVTDGVSDFAWLSSASELKTRAQVTIAPGPNPTVHLANTSTAPVTVTLAASVGDDLTVDIAAGATARVTVQPSTTYELTGFDTLFAAVTVVGAEGIAGYSTHPPGVGSTPVLIYP